MLNIYLLEYSESMCFLYNQQWIWSKW
jgi:hypothetical protein